MAYLNIMKQIARETPEVVKEFTKTVTKPDGTKVESLDGVGIDARITMRAMQYIQDPNAASSGTQSSTPTAALPTTTAAPTTNPPQPYPSNTGSGSSGSQSTDPQGSFGSAIDAFSGSIHSQLDGIRQVVQNQVKQSQVSTANDGTVSLLDLFNMNRALVSFDQSQANANNGMGIF